MDTAVSAIYEQGTLRLLKPIKLPERSRVRVQILTDDVHASVKPVLFLDLLSSLEEMLSSLKATWPVETLRPDLLAALRRRVRDLSYHCPQSRRILCVMLEMAVNHLTPTALPDEQVDALRLCLRTLHQDTLSTKDLNECDRALIASGLPPTMAYDEEMLNLYLEEL